MTAKISDLASDDPTRRERLVRWCDRHAYFATRGALAVIFIWYGALKVAGASPAADLVAQTFFFWPARIVIPVLGAVEIAIGLCLLFRRLLPVGLGLLLAHLAGTLLSLFIVPERCFGRSIFHLTTEGEFILKNLVIISSIFFIIARYKAREPEAGR
jgi:uncharacterized membrane protein YkgB